MSTREERLKNLKAEVAETRKRRHAAEVKGEDPEDIPPTVPEVEPISKALEDVANGVSLSWLHHMFQMDRNTCKMKLAGCPHLRIGRGGTKLYSLAQAAGYLVDPKSDIAVLLRNMKPGDLPPNLQPSVWQAKLARQKWEVNAGDLWSTEDVLDVFAETFKHMRVTMNLWIDTLERKALSEEQREMLVEQVDKLQKDIYRRLVEMPKNRKTRSQLQDLNTVEGPPGQNMDTDEPA